MIDGGVYPPGYRYPDGQRAPKPTNTQELQAMLRADRKSLSPSALSEDALVYFEERVLRETNKANTAAEVFPTIVGTQDRELLQERKLQYNYDTPIVPGTSQPKPDKLYGASADQIAIPVRRDLEQHIVPFSLSDPLVPNHTLELKGERGGSNVLQSQAMNNGAYGARAVHSVQNYGNTAPIYDGCARTVSTTYNDGTLRVYATHLAESTSHDRDAEYFMTHLNSYALIGDADNFRRGATAFRNSRDWAQGQRDLLRSRANAVATAEADAAIRQSSRSRSTRRLTSTGSSVNPALRVASDTSASRDELSGLLTPLKRQRRHGQRLKM